LNTKQVVNNLNRIRSRYKTFKSNWNDANIWLVSNYWYGKEN
jgi:hypothetical protein